jgi:hypothetical protein
MAKKKFWTCDGPNFPKDCILILQSCPTNGEVDFRYRWLDKVGAAPSNEPVDPVDLVPDCRRKIERLVSDGVLVEHDAPEPEKRPAKAEKAELI